MGLKNVIVAAGVVAAVGSSALAGGDIWLSVANNRIELGKIEEFPSTVREAGVRVYDATLGTDVDNAIDEPGLRILSTAEGDGSFPGGTLVGFNFNSPLLAWNGTDFSTVSAWTMTLSFGPLSATTPTSGTGTGFSVPVDADGDLHDHYDFVLDAPTRVSGLWLLNLTFTTNLAGVADSQPAWVVFGQDVTPEQFEAAEDWAKANIPTPGALAMLGVAGLALGRRRR